MKYTKEDIPQEYFSWNNKWNKLAAKWFYEGLKKEELIAKEGINYNEAIREIATILSDWGYEHNLKLAVAAFLLNKYFDVEDPVPPAENKKSIKRPKQEINYSNSSGLGRSANLKLSSLKQQLAGLL